MALSFKENASRKVLQVYMGMFDDTTKWLSEAADTVGTKMSAVQDSVVHAVTHPSETFDKAYSAAEEAATATADYVSERGPLSLLEDGVGVVVGGVQGIGFAAQGVVSGLGSGVASIGDLAINVGYNWTVRNAINLVKDEPLESYDSNFAGKTGAALRFFEPTNDYERAMMSAGQVVGEVGAFVALTVVTAGVGGAVAGGAAAAARGTTVSVRTITALTTSAETLTTGGKAAQAFGQAAQGTANVLANGNVVNTAANTAIGTAKMLNPLASNTALGIEGGLGGYKAVEIFDQDKGNEQVSSQMLADKIETDSQISIEKSDFVQDKDQLLQQEMSDIGATLDQFDNGEIDLTKQEHDDIIARVEELIQADGELSELNGSDIKPEREAELREKLNQALPESQEQAALNQDEISIDDINGTNLASMQDDATLSAEKAHINPTQQVKLDTLNA